MHVIIHDMSALKATGHQMCAKQDRMKILIWILFDQYRREAVSAISLSLLAMIP